ncbi:MAG: beta-ketoacyl synthase [Marinilabiliales bacterium]|nr:MAG: beta-ketoacyl synthase [Marinilabiliales bacterium]
MAFFVADNIISPLGFKTADNFHALAKGYTGIDMINDTKIYPEAFPAAMINSNNLDDAFIELASKEKYTRLEKMLILSIKDALDKTKIDPTSARTGIVLSTTKGNIDLMASDRQNSFEKNRVLLWKLGEVISHYFGNPNQTMVLSNACISGVLAIQAAAMLIQVGKFDHMIVTGGDIVSRFVVSGFMSFLSLSPKACKPFDKDRDGLSLGEAASTIILSKDITGKDDIKFLGGASANDANHISGPSRTGEGSYIAIKKVLEEAGISPGQIDHISAHGTATPYNDEMESIAIDRHHLNEVPVNSLKGSFGHTLGTAGLVETAILLEEMRQNTLLKTTGFSELGVSRKINVISKTTNKELNTCLKMASGFGGSNAAMIIQKA